MKLHFLDGDNAKHVADILMIANGNSSLVAFRAVVYFVPFHFKMEYYMQLSYVFDSFMSYVSSENVDRISNEFE